MEGNKRNILLKSGEDIMIEKSAGVFLFAALVLFLWGWITGDALIFFPFLCLFAAVFLFTVYAVRINKETAIRCRVGWHSFVHIGWDEQMASGAIYECRRCGKRKKVMRAF